MASLRLLPAIGLLVLLLPSPSAAQLRSEVFISGLSAPVAFVQDPSQPNVQFVVEQAGRIRVVQSGTLLATPFLDITSVVGSGGERGLLGLVFAPDYATSRRFWVNFTNLSGHTVVARVLRSAGNPLQADASTRFDLVFPGGLPYITQPFSNHNGGDMHFGADGYLYIAMGDGGSGNDPMNLAQDMTSLLGKVLRIDVSANNLSGYTVPRDNPFHDGNNVSTGVAGEGSVRNLIWSLGWRNPWRFTVDDLAVGGRGAMVLADVGQSAWEEANYEPAGRGGRNYGWRIREGAHPNPAFNNPTTAGLTDPLIEYSHAVGVAITGGPVYRGTGLGLAYFGDYFFADLNGRVWSASLTVNGTSGEATDAVIEEHTGLGSVGTPVSFGTDAACRIYIVDIGGRVLRILPSSLSTASSCATPDPFLALGGGVWNGSGWTPPVTVPAPSSGCSTPDPFAGIPGMSGVCVNGGWVPATQSTPTPPTPPTPPSPPTPPTPSVCAGNAPVSNWVCVNGGWVPPDHPLAVGAPTPPTPPTPSPGGCTGADPFAGIPGMTGVCVNGGWVPTTHPASRRRAS